MSGWFQKFTAGCGGRIAAVNHSALADWHLEPIGDRKQARVRRDTQKSFAAVLGLYGVLTQRGSFWGGTSTDAFGRAFDAAMADSSIHSIVIDCSTPGGDVRGTIEAAAKVRAAKGKKDVIGVVNSDCHSAGYWILSGCKRIVATPSSSTGSIGVWRAHTDISGALKKEGVDVTLVYSGKYKVEGNAFEALPDDAREFFQSEVDAIHNQFVRAVAMGRGVSPAIVREGFGQGRSFMPQQALAAGMIDEIDTFDAVLAEHSQSQVQRRKMALVERMMRYQ